MVDKIEDDNEDIQLENFNINLDEIPEQIDINVEKSIEDPEAILNKKINDIINEIDKNENSDELVSKTIQIYKELGFNQLKDGIFLLKNIINDAYKFSSLNLNKRIKDFFDFLLNLKINLKNFNATLIINMINEANKNLNENNKDIIFIWKMYMAENYLKENQIFIKSKMAKDTMKLLLEYNYNISQIYNFFLIFKEIINDENYSQYEIIKSIISIIISYPKKVDINNLRKFVKNYYIQIKKERNENEKMESSLILNPKVALDYYLELSYDENSENSNSILSIDEIFQQMKIINKDISDKIINERIEQLKIIYEIINNPIYQNFTKSRFQEWTKNEFHNLKFDTDDNINYSTSIILGMISHAIKHEKGYYLRDTQLIAILMFIGKDKKYGLIEEISTGEGKSCIICSLAIYFALRNHKVDIISSSYTLAQRDSDEFKNIYQYFNLTTGYPYYYQSKPYTVDILYGTFLEFEGDYLREITSNIKIRNNRPYDVIIIDEVDNLFIDNILSSTRLVNPSKGFKFLIPIYLSNYISFELFDFFFIIYFNLSLKDVNKEKRKKYEDLIKSPKERKKEVLKMLENLFENIFNPEKEKKFKYEISKINKNNQKKINKEIIKVQNNIENINKNEFFENLEENLDYPEFLDNFVKNQSSNWINSAYDAKNLMIQDKNYVISNKRGQLDIAPVDRENTGEIELSRVYSEGLHQMLQIKHLLRVKDENLVHTFLSNITYFERYKKKDNFLFFGLTGTIGDSDTQKIYQNNYFNSKLLFIPQYKKKRFIELPAILCDIKEHYNIICEDIITNFLKGRKILVICSSIKEANILKEKLKNYKINSTKISNITDEDIILYTRSDTDEKYNIIRGKNKRIFLSTNLGGRGTDIQTNIEEEKYGGMHVILTDMPNNYRVLKQAFGRTSREGKKGTGQMILKNTGYNSYSELFNDMNKQENERIQKILSKLKLVLFKDRLFEQYYNQFKNIDFNSSLSDDINERWAHFLNENVTNINYQNFNEKEIIDKFQIFIDEIKTIISDDKNNYKKFKNPFFKMEEGLRLYKNYEEELLKYFDYNIKKKKFFFVQPYIISIIKITNSKLYDEKFFNDVLENLNESKNRVNLLIEKSIKPFMNSFKQWGDIINNFNLDLTQNEEYLIEIQKPLVYQDYKNSELYKQYNNIYNILKKIEGRIKENIYKIEQYKSACVDENSKIFIIQEDLEDGLELTPEEKKELEYFKDASFHYVYKFGLKRKLELLETKFWKFNIIGAILMIIGFVIIPCITSIIGAGILIGDIYLLNKGYNEYKDVEFKENTIFSKILKFIINKFDKREQKNDMIKIGERNYEQNIENNIIKNSKKNQLLNMILENVENKFEGIKKLDIVKFLIFIDNYLSVSIWNKKIKEIFRDNFRNIYESKFNEKKDIFETEINNENMKIQCDNYNSIFEEYYETCYNDIKKLKNKKEYDEKTGLNCLEHLIKNLNPEQIDENIANKTVKIMLKYQLINENGIINKKLFEDCFYKKIDGKINKLNQLFPINIINKKENEIIQINNLKEFIIKDNNIPMVDPFLMDLCNFYKHNKYNVKEELEKDYSLYIIDNFKKIIINIISINKDIFESFYKDILNLIKSLIRTLLEEKIFSKYNQKSLENEILNSLTDEEKEEFKKMIKNAGNNALNYIKNN